MTAQQDEFEAKAASVWWKELRGEREHDIERIADALRAEHTRGQIEGLQLALDELNRADLDPECRDPLPETRNRIAELRKGRT